METRGCCPQQQPSDTPTIMAVTKRPGSPFWYVQFQYNGQTYIKSTKTTDKKLAAKLEHQWRSDLIAQQQLGVKPTLTVQQAFQAYATSKSSLVSAANIAFWSRRASEFWKDTTYIHQITTAEIERYKHQMAMASYANQTIKHALNCVSGAIKHAKRMGYNVADDLQMPVVRLPKGRLRYLSVEEEQRLLKAIDPKRVVKGLAVYEERIPELQKEMQDIYDFVVR